MSLSVGTKIGPFENPCADRRGWQEVYKAAELSWSIVAVKVLPAAPARAMSQRWLDSNVRN
jgi:hypothetical protein